MMRGACIVALFLVSSSLALPVDSDAQGTEIQTPSNSSTQGYVRLAIDATKCPNACSGRGHCVHNTAPNAPPEDTVICICDKGWTGADCAAVLLPSGERSEGEDCPNHCSSHGVCHRGSSVIKPRCYCDPHFTGLDCSQVREDSLFCPRNCSGFGVCTQGWSDRYGAVVATCMCDPNHKGEDCSLEVHSPCKGGCSGNGECTASGCVCAQGFIGSDCSLRDIPECLNNCSSRGRCLRGECFCNAGYEGADCSAVAQGNCPKGCGAHGRCVPDTKYFPGGCACEKGWYGEDCSVPKTHQAACPLACSGHGFCGENGTCLCSPGFNGAGCEFDASLPDGLGEAGDVLHPHYMDKKILAKSEFDRSQIVETDEHPGCPNHCSSHGVCQQVVTDKLAVYHPDGQRVEGEAAELDTPTTQFLCRCDPGFSGPDCSIKSAGLGAPSPPTAVTPTRALDPAGPQPNHLFTEDTTQWDELPTGTQLKIKHMPCPANCSSRGRCLRDERGYPFCSCYTGWTSLDCSTPIPSFFSCPLDCSGHGKCVTASEYFPVHCMCDKGWHGESCEKPNPVKVTYDIEEDGFCPNHCSHRGVCMAGKCVCMELGYGGEDCSVQAGGECPSNCNGNGMCFWGTCECLGGYSGALCDVEPPKPCPNNCQMHGKCVGGQCVCLTGFTGDDCSEIMVECPHHCSGHGLCLPAEPKQMLPARCDCNEGYTGADCSNFPVGVTPPVVREKGTAAQQAAAAAKEKQEAKKSVFTNPQ